MSPVASSTPATTSSLTASIQVLINTLTAQLQTLLTQSRKTGGTASPTGSVAFVFTRDLQLYDAGPDVKALQELLNSKGFLISETGPGSPAHETTVFGTKTWEALIRFQKTAAITPASGYFGPITRAYVNAGK
jgi:peptidoglycan hydrolase-like protein with peptidoglycan-binding domain